MSTLTLAVLLGCHALRRGYEATIYTFNLQVFDPTWFEEPTDHTKIDATAEATRFADPLRTSPAAVS